MGRILAAIFPANSSGWMHFHQHTLCSDWLCLEQCWISDSQTMQLYPARSIETNPRHWHRNTLVDWNPFQFPQNSNSLHTFAFVNIGNDKRLFIVDSATVNPDSGVTKGGWGGRKQPRQKYFIDHKLNFMKFAEWANSSLSQQTITIFAANLFRH